MEDLSKKEEVLQPWKKGKLLKYNQVLSKLNSCSSSVAESRPSINKSGKVKLSGRLTNAIQQQAGNNKDINGDPDPKESTAGQFDEVNDEFYGS